MRVVLDTNAFRDWAGTRPPSIQRLLRASQDGDIELLVPEVVIVECARLFEKHHARPAAKKMREAMHAARRAGTLPAALDGFKPDAVADRDAYEDALRDELDEHDVIVVELPDAGHDKVLERIKARRKPSKPDDDQYRDILIWESIVEHLAAIGSRLRRSDQLGQTILITSNHRDFGTGEGNPDIHAELADDLEAVGLARDAVTLLGHPQQLVARHFAVRDSVSEYVESLVAGEDTDRELLQDLRRLLPGEAISGDIDWPYEGEIQSQLISSVWSLNTANVETVYDVVPGERYGVALVLDIEVDIEVFVSAPTPWDLDANLSDVHGDPAGGGYIISTENKRLRVSLEVVWDVEKNDWDAESVEVGEATEIHPQGD